MPDGSRLDPPDSYLERDEVAPLLDALHDLRPDVRVGVLDSLLALPLAPESWLEVGEYVRWALQADSGAPERHEVVARAGRVPLISVREALRLIARSDDPAAPAAARSLAEAGDDAALEPLLAELDPSTREPSDAARYLAMIDVTPVAGDVEHAFTEAMRTGDEGAFWAALSLARAGEDTPLRTYFDALESGATELPTIFWGNPWAARNELAPGPPLPASFVSWLTSFGDAPDSRSDVNVVASALIEADQTPPTPGPVADIDPSRVPTAGAIAAAAPLVASLVTPGGDLHGDWEGVVAALIPRDRVAVISALVTTLLTRAQDFVASNAAVRVAYDHSGDFVPDVRALAALDTEDGDVREQTAWAASRGGARLLVASVADNLASSDSRPEAVQFLSRAATYVGMPGPLFRGAGPVGPLPPPLELLDDTSMAEPIEEPAMEEAELMDDDMPWGDAALAEPSESSEEEFPPPEPAAVLPGQPISPPPERFLQAEVFDTSESDTPVRLSRGFRRGAWHSLVVYVGPERTTALPSQGPSFDAVFGPQEGDLLLEFAFIATGFVHEDHELQFEKVRLPVGGSAEAAFDFQLLPELDEVRIELEVRVHGRVIQPATLVGLGADDPATLPDYAVIRLLRGRPIANPDSAQSRAPLDGAVSVLGARSDASPVATVIAQDRIHYLNTNALKDATRRFEKLLDSIVTDRDAPRSLADQPAVRQLFQLAVRGAQLYDAVGAEIVKTLGTKASRIQLLLRDDSVTIPLELAYDLGAPASRATICSNWKAALAHGECDSRFHPKAADGNLAVVCPAGFWALSKTIERQVASPSLFTEHASSFDAAARAELSSESDDLPLRGGAVFAASDLVPRTEFRRLCKTLNTRVGLATCTSSWSDWRRGIESVNSILVLLSHTVRDDTGWALQVGPVDAPSLHD
jgi:hypothetical protein